VAEVVSVTERDEDTDTLSEINPEAVIVNGQAVNVGDTVVFTVLKTNGQTDHIRVVLGGVESRQLFKVVGDSNRLYQILPAMSVWVADKQSTATAIAYLEDPQRLLLLGPSKHNTYRSHGIASERTVIDVAVSSAIYSELHASI
jgi:hypothetical protein